MAKAKLDYKPYPRHLHRITGCKVSWLYFDNEEDAKSCSKIATHNARINESLGYDFGYCSPGSISNPGQRGELRFGHLWEVCIS